MELGLKTKLDHIVAEIVEDLREWRPTELIDSLFPQIYTIVSNELEAVGIEDLYPDPTGEYRVRYDITRYIEEALTIEIIKLGRAACRKTRTKFKKEEWIL